MKKNQQGNGIRNNQKSEVKRRSDRAKELTNDGELSKAFATMVQRGVAPSTDEIVAQLSKKFPSRKSVVRWPDKEKIDDLRRLVEKIPIEMEVDECSNELKDATSEAGGLASET